jgi:N4-gp56 family major capsid protein
MAAGDIYKGGNVNGTAPGGPNDAGTAGGRSLANDQHAGGGPILTASGVGLAGVRTPNDPSTNLAAGGATFGDLAVVKESFDKVIRYRNRLEPNYRQFANVRAVREAAFPGSKVTVFRTGANGLPLALDPLSEYADPDAKALLGLEDKLDVTVDEYGESTVVTQRLSRFSWTQINPMQVEAVRRNMMDTVDATYMNSIYAATGGFLKAGFRQAEVKGAGTAQTVTLTATTAGAGLTDMAEDKLFLDAGLHGMITAANRGSAKASATGLGWLEAAAIRRIVGHFRSLGVAPYADGNYLGLITPDASIKLRETTDLAGWRYPHLDGTANGNIWNGTVGIFEGIRFIEGPQFRGLDKGDKVLAATNNIVNVKPKTPGLSNLLFLGAEGICDVIVEDPHTVITPTTDKFGRLFGLGWIGCWGSMVYDNNAGLLVAVKSGL